MVEDIAPGIDEIMIRQPVGVCATIAPFNFPGMIPFWYLPYALAAGNTYIVKPSEKVPMTMQFIFKLIEQVGFPKGVVNLVNGAKDAVDGILEHPAIRAITFVGSTECCQIYLRHAAANGKRVQAQGGAKNPVIILPDADMEMATKIIADSAFGCAGQRCLAVSFAVTVAEARNTVHRADLRCGRQPRGGLWTGCRRPDGTGHQRREQGARRAVDRARRPGRSQPSPWMDAGRRSRAMKVDTLSARPSWQMSSRGSEICEDGDLWTGVESDARQYGG